MTTVSLEPITADNWRAVAELELPPEQRDLVMPNLATLAQCYVHRDIVWPRAILADGELVGLCVLVIEPDAQRVHLARIMIAAPAQRRGYGAAAVGLLRDKTRSLGWARSWTTSCLDRPGGAVPFFARCGFLSTGEHDDDGELKLVEML